MAAEKVCATPCSNCDRKGLPILFTRYAVAYSAQKANMALLKQLSPAGQLQERRFITYACSVRAICTFTLTEALSSAPTMNGRAMWCIHKGI